MLDAVQGIRKKAPAIASFTALDKGYYGGSNDMLLLFRRYYFKPQLDYSR
jgi:hypothetical protein